MVGPKYRKTAGGYLGWAAGKVVRITFFFLTGYFAYDYFHRRSKKKVIEELEKLEKD